MKKWIAWALFPCSIACGSAPSPAPETLQATPADPTRGTVKPLELAGAECTLAAPREAMTRVGDIHRGAPLAIVRRDGRRIALVADPDTRSVLTVDTAKDGAVIAKTFIGGKPRELLVLEDGRVAATVEDQGLLLVMDWPTVAGPLVGLCSRPIGLGAWGLAESDDGGHLVATSGWGKSSLVSFDAKTFATTGKTTLPRSARGVVIGADQRAYVAHMAGSAVSVVDFERPDRTSGSLSMSVLPGAPDYRVEPLPGGDGVSDGSGFRSPRSVSAPSAREPLSRSNAQAYVLASVRLDPPASRQAEPAKPTTPEHSERRRILVPMVSVNPGDPRLPTTYYGNPSDGVARHTPFMGVVDAGGGRRLGTRTSPDRPGQACLLPRAIAVDERNGIVFVACVGLNAVVELDAWAAEPFRAERSRIGVPDGPFGLVYDADTRELIVVSQFARSVSVFEPGSAGIGHTISLGEIAMDPDARAGRKLFYGTNTRLSRDGMACASCHPDGLDDGLTWQTPEGPRQTLMLAGRLKDSAPYGWMRGEKTLEGYVHDTIQRLGGEGLLGREMTALTTYLKELRQPINLPDDRSSRGRELFFAKDSGCADCHTAGRGVDGRSHQFDSVQTPAEGVNTPSLIGIGSSAPYFHDGRYATLEELLADPTSFMGRSATLSKEDRAALAEYLNTL